VVDSYQDTESNLEHVVLTQTQPPSLSSSLPSVGYGLRPSVADWCSGVSAGSTAGPVAS